MGPPPPNPSHARNCRKENVNPLSRNKRQAFHTFEAFCRQHVAEHLPTIYQYMQPHLTALSELYGRQSKKVKLVGKLPEALHKAFDPLWANSYEVEGDQHINALSAYVFGLANRGACGRRLSEGSVRSKPFAPKQYTIPNAHRAQIHKSLNY